MPADNSTPEFPNSSRDLMIQDGKISLNFREKTTILVDFFIRKESLENWTATDWSRERFGAKKLITKYPDFEFFYSLPDLYGKFNSLLGISDKYVKGLTRRYEDFIIEKSKKVSYNLSDQPVIQIEKIKGKAKNLMEFLDN